MIWILYYIICCTQCYSGIQCYTVLQWNTVEYSAIQWNTVRHSGIQCDTVRPSATVEYSATQCDSGIYECQNSENDPLKKGLPL